jgi:hypothetical protein
MNIEFDLMPSGELRLSRKDVESNNGMTEFLKELGVENYSDLEEFFSSEELIKHIIGEEGLCG